MTNLAELVASLEDIPTANADQHQAARAYVEQHAPDLLAAIFGEAS